MAGIYIADPIELNDEAIEGYQFQDRNGSDKIWPKTCGETLGAAGAFNFFLRAGFKVQIIGQADIAKLKSDDILVIDIPKSWGHESERLEPYTKGAHRLVYSGNFFPVAERFNASNAELVQPSSPYNCFGIEFDGREALCTPPSWGYYRAHIPDNNGERVDGDLFEIFGDRFCPHNASRRKTKDGFLIISSHFGDREQTFINGFMFAALQCWLQGQEDLTPWLAWNSRQHWLDDYVDLVFEIILKSEAIDFSSLEKLTALPQQTICLRHDNDDSIDATFADVEHEAGVETTFAVLDDHLLPAWKEIALKYPEHEYALHYTTIQPRYKFNKYIAYAISKTPWRTFLNKYVIGKQVLSGGKLYDQVRAAKKKGLSVKTIHRHFSYLPYPEYIDELDGVYKSDMGVVASNSLFRGHLYRWGGTALDGTFSTTGQYPDSQHPYWMPFKIAHAAQRGRILDGWEATMLMEIEPDFLDKVLNVKHKNLPNKFMTICFHPAGTKKSPIKADGTLSWLQACIQMSKRKKIALVRYDKYIETLHGALQESK